MSAAKNGVAQAIDVHLSQQAIPDLQDELLARSNESDADLVEHGRQIVMKSPIGQRATQAPGDQPTGDVYGEAGADGGNAGVLRQEAPAATGRPGVVIEARPSLPDLLGCFGGLRGVRHGCPFNRIRSRFMKLSGLRGGESSPGVVIRSRGTFWSQAVPPASWTTGRCPEVPWNACRARSSGGTIQTRISNQTPTARARMFRRAQDGPMEWTDAVAVP